MIEWGETVEGQSSQKWATYLPLELFVHNVR